MGPVVDEMPLLDKKGDAKFKGAARDQQVPLQRYTPYVWLTVTSHDVSRKELGESTRWFPALVDTGTNESLVLHEWHLKEWAGMEMSGLPTRRQINLYGIAMPVFVMDVWLSRYGVSPITSPPSNAGSVKMQVSGGVVVSQAYKSRIFSLNSSKSIKDSDAQASRALQRLYHSNQEASKSGSVPLNIHPRIPVVGVKLLYANSLNLTLHPRDLVCTLSQTP